MSRRLPKQETEAKSDCLAVEDPRQVSGHASLHRAEHLVGLVRPHLGIAKYRTRVTVFYDFIVWVVAGEGIVVAVDQRHDFAADAGHEVMLGAGIRNDELLRRGAVVYPMFQLQW